LFLKIKKPFSIDTYSSFLTDIVHYEQKGRKEKKIEKHFKRTTIPFHKTLHQFDVDKQESLSKKQFSQFKELLWIEQLSPSVGKTHLAVGLRIQTVNKGYKMIFTSTGGTYSYH